MSLLLLVPAFICLYFVLRGSIDKAFLSVYLPCLLSLPDNYRLRITHLPPTSVAEFVLIPLGVVATVKLIRTGSFALMDLLVPLFCVSISLSEILHSPLFNDGLFAAFDAFISIFMAYAVGRTLIEPRLRVATVRRFVTLVLFDGIPGVYEWRMGGSLYGMFAVRVLGLDSMSERVQMRNGFGRMGTFFSGPEPGGIAFAMTFCLNAWMVYMRRVKASVDFGGLLDTLEKYHAPGLLLFLYVMMTQSRGPQLALGAGYIILQIPRFKSTRMVMILVAVLLVGGYLGAQSYFASFKNLDHVETEQQGSALYRLKMNELYPPIAEKGGWTGYGVLQIPQIQGMNSLDNHYLLVHLAWGRFGYICFLLIAWENLRVLLVRSWQIKDLEDRAFVFSMLAAMSVLWFTLLTVFLGGQLPQIAFLLIGWIQSAGAPRAQRFTFRRVFT